MADRDSLTTRFDLSKDGITSAGDVEMAVTITPPYHSVNQRLEVFGACLEAAKAAFQEKFVEMVKDNR